jgi:hypothetical protein
LDFRNQKSIEQANVYCRFYLILPDSHSTGPLLHQIQVPYSKRVDQPDILIAEIGDDLSLHQHDAIVNHFSGSQMKQLLYKVSFAEISLCVWGGAFPVSMPQYFAKCALNLGIDICLRYSRYTDEVPGVSMSDESFALYDDLLRGESLRNIIHLSYSSTCDGSISRLSRWAAGEYIPDLSPALSIFSCNGGRSLPEGWLGIEFQDFTRFFLGGLVTRIDLTALGVSDSRCVKGIEFNYVSIDL